jgi:hypothetical protein
MIDNAFQEFKSLEDVFLADIDGILNTPRKPVAPTSSDRVFESFQEINDFYRTHGREPSADTTDISERRLGARLEGFRLDSQKSSEIISLDEFGLLKEDQPFETLAELLGNSDAKDLIEDASGLLDLTSLPKRATRTEPDEVAKRTRCLDFEHFEELFKQKHDELRTGVSKLVPFSGEEAIIPGAFFILSGVMLFVADLGEELAVSGKRTRYKRRTRTIYENGTESSLFGRSLASQLFENDGLQVVTSSFESLLADDEATGWLYILKSLSEDPQIAGKANLYKIGFSTTPVAQRIANARNETTYLMAPVEIVAEYRTYNLKTSALEHLLHIVFGSVRLDVGQVGKDGNRYKAKEWFVAPLAVINQAIHLISSGEIIHYVYDKASEKLIELDS